MTTWEEVFASRNTREYRMSDGKGALVRLTEVLAAQGIDPQKVGEIVAAYVTDANNAGPTLTIQRITAAQDDRLKACANQTERKMNPLTKQWEGGDADKVDLAYCRVGFAIVAPAFPEGLELPSDEGSEAFKTAIRKRADYLKANLAESQMIELVEALADVNRFGLTRAERR